MNRIIHVISDTHNKHSELLIPKSGGDILIHCGDATVKGNFSEGLNFLQWFVKQPYKYKVICYGNHARKLKTHPDLISLAREYGIIVLHQDDPVREILGLKIWGGQFVPSFKRISGDPRHDVEEQKVTWKNMPEDLDILVTHVPPKFSLDLTLSNEHIGCEKLTEEIKLKKPKLNVCGHVHEQQQKSVMIFDTKVINCANLNREYLMNINEPLEVIL